MRKQSRRSQRHLLARRLNLEPLEDRELLSGLNVVASSALSSPSRYESRSASSRVADSYGGARGQSASSQIIEAGASQSLRSDSAPAAGVAQYQRLSPNNGIQGLAAPGANGGSNATRESQAGNRSFVLYDDRLAAREAHSSPTNGSQPALAADPLYSKSDSGQESGNYSAQQGEHQAYDSSLGQEAEYPTTASARPAASEATATPNPGPPDPSIVAARRLATQSFFAAVRASDAPKVPEQRAPEITVVRTATPSLNTIRNVQAQTPVNSEVGGLVARASDEERELVPPAEARPTPASPSAGVDFATSASEGSNLLTGILSFDWPATEAAIERFFDQFDNLPEQLADSRTAVSLARWLGASMAVTLTFDFTRRYLKKRAALGMVESNGWNGPTSTWFPGMADPVSDG
jgi:hypothetical protein